MVQLLDSENEPEIFKEHSILILGMTPLHHTAIRGNQQALEKLLSTPGIIKEPRDFQDSTPLHLASTYNHPNVAITLLKNGDANPRALDNDLRYEGSIFQTFQIQTLFRVQVK